MSVEKNGVEVSSYFGKGTEVAGAEAFESRDRSISDEPKCQKGPNYQKSRG